VTNRPKLTIEDQETKQNITTGGKSAFEHSRLSRNSTRKAAQTLEPIKNRDSIQTGEGTVALIDKFSKRSAG